LPEANVFVGGSNRPAEGTALPTNQWTHLAGTYDGAVVRLFVNGVQAASTNVSGSISVSNGALRIGGNSISGESVPGLIDEVRVYNNALTQAQIRADMSTPVGGGLDTTPPTVSSVSPPHGATKVSTGANLTVRFNEALGPTTVSTGTFELRNP